MRYISLFALAPLMIGCSVGPDYFKPATPTPQTWTEQSGPDTQSLSTAWWRGFAQAPLDTIMAQALKSNYDLSASLARIRQADAQLRISSSALLPSIVMGASSQRQVSQTLSTGRQDQYNTFSLLPGASYEIDFWGKNHDLKNVAIANRAARQFDFQTTTLTVEASVANTYFTILALQERIKVAENNLSNALNTLEAFKARLHAGTASGLDVAQQESVVAEQRAALPPLTQALRQNTYALAILIGALPEGFNFNISALDTDHLPAVGAGLPSQLLKRRPDVHFAEQQLIAANANLKYSIASVYPSIVLTAEGGVQSNALKTLLDPVSLLFSIGASLTQPLYKGDALEGGIELAKGEIDELTANYQKSVISAFEDVEAALAAVELTAAEESAQLAAVETAQKAEDIILAQMRSGTVDILTVLNVQRTLFQAQDQLVQVKLARLQSLVGLFRALGGGWES